MPIYEYECKKCKTHIEAFQKVSDKPLTKCRKCGGKLEKKISAPAIQFKGSGWYITDYAKKSGSDAGKTGSSSSSSSDTSSSKETSKDSPTPAASTKSNKSE